MYVSRDHVYASLFKEEDIREADSRIVNSIIKTSQGVILNYLGEKGFHIPVTLDEVEESIKDRRIEKIKEINKMIEKKVRGSPDIQKLCSTLYEKT
jgi:hypothetical protein